MFLRCALGAALLAVPLAGAAGQSASQHDPTARPAGDSSSGGHRFVWVAAAGAAGAGVFTTFVRLSERGASVDAERGLTLPNSPVPNHYTDGSLPGSGVSPGQNAPPPGQTPSTDPNTPTTDDAQTLDTGAPGPIVLNQSPPPGNEQPPPDSTDTYTPPGSIGGDETDQPPTYTVSPNAIVITTPEPEALVLVGTGLVPLVPTLRRRRSRS